jgi:hypothetical protein
VRRWRLLQIGGRAGEQRGKWGGGVGSGVPPGGGRKRERGGGQRGVGSQTVGPEWLQAARSEAAARAHGGGGLANRGGRWGTGNAVRRD